MGMATIYFPAIQDAYVSEFYRDTNFGSSPALFIGQFNGCGDDYRSLLQFDLCSNRCNQIPPDSTIDCAFLRLYIYRNEIPCGSITATIYRLLERFNQNTVTWNNQPLRYGIPSGSTTISANTLGFIKIDITDLVRDWYEGAIEPYGIIIEGDETQNSLVGFRSLDFFDSTFWPRLIVNYHQNCCY